MTQLHELSALEQWESLQRGEFSPRELTQHYLDRIEKLNPVVGAFHEVTPELAIARAEDVELNVPRSAILWGLPFADKDLSQRQGVRTTFGSRVFRDFVPEESDEIATVLDDAGGISVGKTATPEFGFPSYTENLVAPPARNPWDLTRGPGGSSGGAAVAVAARLLPFAPGSDGGGSIRIPAAACGLVGVKPSRGLVPAGSGIGSLAGLPVAGPIARSVADAALLLDGMIARRSGVIQHHHTLRAPDSGPFLGAALRGEGRFQIGVLTSSPWQDDYEITVEPEALATLNTAVDALTAMGHGIESTDPDWGSGYAAAFRVVWQVGAGALPVNQHNEHLLERLTLWLHHRGKAVSAVELAQALTTLSEFEARVLRQFDSYDAVISPALAMVPRPIGWWDDEDGEHNFAQQVQYTPFTSFVNASGLPAIAVPVNQTSEGLPLGVQLIGRPGGEATLFALARQLERQFRGYERAPEL